MQYPQYHRHLLGLVAYFLRIAPPRLKAATLVVLRNGRRGPTPARESRRAVAFERSRFWVSCHVAHTAFEQEIGPECSIKVKLIPDALCGFPTLLASSELKQSLYIRSWLK